MRRAVTFARLGTKYTVLMGPEVPLREHIESFKEAVGSAQFAGAEEIEIWTSEGRIKRAKSPEQKPHRKTKRAAAKPAKPVLPQPPADQPPAPLAKSPETKEDAKQSAAPAPSPDTKGMGDILKNSQPQKNS